MVNPQRASVLNSGQGWKMKEKVNIDVKVEISSKSVTFTIPIEMPTYSRGYLITTPPPIEHQPKVIETSYEPGVSWP